MAEQQNTGRHNFSDYLYILFKWKKFLIINLIIVTAIATLIAFLIPQTFRAKAVIMAAPDNSMGFGGLTGLLSGKTSATSISSKLFGVASTSNDMLFGLLNSRTMLTDVIKKFDLMKYYEVTDSNMDKTIKDFSGDISFDPDENGMIEISVINKSPQASSEIANYFVRLLDSLNIQMNIEQAKNDREFIEQRYNKNVSDLKSAEDSLYVFEKKYGVIAVPQQVEAAVKASAELESMLAQKELMVELMKNNFGISSPQYKDALDQVKFLKQKVEDLKNSKDITKSSNVFLPFKEVPKLSLDYYRYFREIEIQTKIMEVILPMYEQAKVDEQKSMPTILIIDKAVPPQLKYGPKKGFIILTVFFISFFFFTITIFGGEKIIKEASNLNPLEEKELKAFQGILKFYRMKNFSI